MNYLLVVQVLVRIPSTIKQDKAIQASAGDVSARLPDEQRRAIEHITEPERIAAVVGFTGEAEAHGAEIVLVGDHKQL
ncbi:hypothetical protein [Agrobacterium sp. NPDC089420]|uniref:hypothetical protein n=1 Tax=Agrobacterium sp. NPDC089420 TaxID=3363918 RepID=UPI00385000B9